jgi:hypothetical protein
MAYTPTVTITAVGSGDYVVQVSEVEASAASETTIVGLPPKGRVRSQICQLISGTGSTIDPVLGTATNPDASALTRILANGTAAAGVNNQATAPITYYDEDGTLYHRSVVNDATADHTIATLYYISAGWGE